MAEGLIVGEAATLPFHVLHCIALNCTDLPPTELYSTAFHCGVLPCITACSTSTVLLQYCWQRSRQIWSGNPSHLKPPEIPWATTLMLSPRGPSLGLKATSGSTNFNPRAEGAKDPLLCPSSWDCCCCSDDCCWYCCCWVLGLRGGGSKGL